MMKTAISLLFLFPLWFAFVEFLFEILVPMSIPIYTLRDVHSYTSLSQKYPLTHNTINSARTAAARNNLYSVERATFECSFVSCLPNR